MAQKRALQECNKTATTSREECFSLVNIPQMCKLQSTSASTYQNAIHQRIRDDSLRRYPDRRHLKSAFLRLTSLSRALSRRGKIICQIVSRYFSRSFHIHRLRRRRAIRRRRRCAERRNELNGCKVLFTLLNYFFRLLSSRSLTHSRQYFYVVFGGFSSLPAESSRKENERKS